MDRSWITDGTPFTPQYMKGVSEFMEFVRQRYSADEDILFPCRDCLNVEEKNQSVVEDHIHMNGMSNAYTKWIFHGEDDSDDEGGIGGHDVGQQDDADQRDDFGEHNDNDQNDVFDDVVVDNIPDMVNDLFKSGMQSDGEPNLFSNLMGEARKELYPGHSCFTRLAFIIKLLHIKSYNKTTNRAFNQYLQLLSSAFPAANIPKSYSEAKSVLHEVGLGYQSIHVCKFDCELFWGEHKNKEHCPSCGTYRWKDGEGKRKVPHKVLRYFPIIPRLQRLFVAVKQAENARWHKDKRVNEDGVLRHPADGEGWKDFDNEYGWFAEDPRNFRLGVTTDGFNPFGNMSNSYSMWPVFIIPYNFPPWICMDQANFMMALLIPGRRSPGKEFHVFMKPLIADMKKLWRGVETFDASTVEKFPLHAAFLWSIHDYPGLATLSGRSTSGYYACVYCDENACYEKLRCKIGYVGHRRFLPTNHPFHRSKLFNGKVERRGAPRKFTMEEVLERLEKVEFKPGKHPTNKRKRKRHDDKFQPCWSQKSSFYDLEYWPKLKLPHNLDVMHIEKNICDNILGTLLEIEGKSKDTSNARKDLEDWNIREDLHLKHNEEGVLEKKEADYTLGKEGKKKLCQFLANVKFPDGYASNIATCVDVDACKIQGLKTHDCHILLQRVLPIALRGLVKKEIYEAIAELGSFFRELCSRTLKREVLMRLKADIPIILCKLEKIFPPSFFTVMVHLCVHLPDEALLRGPVHYGWMYPVERRLGSLKATVRNKAKPEGSIAEGYIVDECLEFCSRYLKEDILTRHNKPDRNKDCKGCVPPDALPIFSSGTKCFGSSKLQHVVEKEFDKLVWLVIENCPEAQKYIDVFKLERMNKGVNNIDESISKEFPMWFRNHIESLYYQGDEEVSEDLYSLAVGPDHRVLVWSACNVNGGRFHTVDREKHRKTQNSGIRSLADDADGVEHEYYGVLKEVIELQYTANKHGDRSVYFFRCDWFVIDGCRRTGMKDDGYFKSVNVSARRYKEDPFILSSQAKSMFYLDDTLLGNNWRVVQNFNHRNLYDVPEKESGTDGEEMNADAYQEENGSNDYVVHDVGAEANEDEQEKEDEEEQPADVQTNNDDRDDEVSSSSSDEVEQPKIMEANEESEDSDVD